MAGLDNFAWFCPSSTDADASIHQNLPQEGKGQASQKATRRQSLATSSTWAGKVQVILKVSSTRLTGETI